jgi:hypothetical protein
MWCQVSDNQREAHEETRVLSTGRVEEMDEELRRRVSEADPEALVGEQRLLTLLLTLLRDDDDEGGRRVAREKLGNDQLLLALLANALQYADWFGHLQRLTDTDWLTVRVAEVAERYVGKQLPDDQARALSLTQRRLAETAERAAGAE